MAKEFEKALETFARKYCAPAAGEDFILLHDEPEQIPVVLVRLAAFVAKGLKVGSDETVLGSKLDRVLDELAQDDYFGTEQQCDPRGDPR